MIRCGFASDKENATCLYKTSIDGDIAAGLMLTGFGTPPVPGAICDNPIQKTVDFAATYFQKVMDTLLEQEYTDLEAVKSILLQKCAKLNDNLAHISRSVGFGVYLTGTICYVANERFICLPFGGAYACVWDRENFTPLTNKALPEQDPLYIRDALGGAITWPGAFDEGTLAVGSQILCMTQPPPEGLLEPLMSRLIHTNQVVLPASIYKGLERGIMPLAVLNIAQAANLGPARIGNNTKVED